MSNSFPGFCFSDHLHKPEARGFGEAFGDSLLPFFSELEISEIHGRQFEPTIQCMPGQRFQERIQ